MLGAVVPEAEWEWDGEPAYGTGDYRIPSVMRTDLAGNPVDSDQVYDHQGTFVSFNLPFYGSDINVRACCFEHGK